MDASGICRRMTGPQKAARGDCQCQWDCLHPPLGTAVRGAGWCSRDGALVLHCRWISGPGRGFLPPGQARRLVEPRHWRVGEVVDEVLGKYALSCPPRRAPIWRTGAQPPSLLGRLGRARARTSSGPRDHNELTDSASLIAVAGQPADDLPHLQRHQGDAQFRHSHSQLPGQFVEVSRLIGQQLPDT